MIILVKKRDRWTVHLPYFVHEIGRKNGNIVYGSGYSLVNNPLVFAHARAARLTLENLNENIRTNTQIITCFTHLPPLFEL